MVAGVQTLLPVVSSREQLNNSINNERLIMNTNQNIAPIADSVVGATGRALADQRPKSAVVKPREVPSAQAWLASGERIGYDLNPTAIVPR